MAEGANQRAQHPPLQQQQASHTVFPISNSVSDGRGTGGSAPQELSFAVALSRATVTSQQQHSIPTAAIAGDSGEAHGNDGARAPWAVVPMPREEQSPAVEGAGPSTVTPRVAAVRNSLAGKSPSIGTLMGQWSDLQRDFAAMSSPLQRPHSRGALGS